MNKNCYLLYGDDHFSIKEKTNQILLENDIPEDAIEIYDYEEVGLHIALSNALTLPFLVDKKGVVVRNSSFLKKQGKMDENENEELIRFCKMNVQETVFIIQAPYEQLDGQKKIVKFLKKNILHHTYNQNKSLNVFEYVKDKLLENQIKIETFALTQFVNRINHDLDSVNNEIEKLIAYSSGKDIINSEIISQITVKDVDDNIYNLVNALLDNNKTKLMEIYQELKSINTSEIWMISAISNKFLEILHTKSLTKIGYNQSDIMSYFNVSSGRAYYMKKNAEETDMDELIKHMTSLANLDYKIKSGQIDKSLGVELFLLNV
ncbi:MAG: DNA polymerase III subunit delta [Candidatus Izemoplasmatales bacterium]|uniref:DNA polymerase III subunit delta n=1 Tax=Hujiaoplasma nucleasis TaxID=2725268 RepID=A0A7L6N2L7_9MOLU|nr:DNA polymerase III subunit delta [Hujiaoplasma nucleasis]QLY39468.1 DNA polymerase III subunit delta [Hujiaoplasma nucleasis]